MKFPSLFRTATPMRFEIKPRYYDPIKEEIEQRTARIKEELREEGLLDEEDAERGGRPHVSGIRGAFTQYRGIKSTTKNDALATGSIRAIFFLIMVVGVFGYIYIGPAVLNYLLYGAVALGGGYYLFQFLKRGRNDD